MTMVNENLWTYDGVDEWEWLRKDVWKVTEQDVKRWQADAKKAKKAQEEIQKDKAKNNNIAKFLGFLLKNIKNDELMNATYNTFFKVFDKKTNQTYVRKSINNFVMVGFFAPFFVQELERFDIKQYYQDIIGNNNINLDNYINYIRRLSKKYHDNIPISRWNLVDLIALILFEFGKEENKDQLHLDKLKKNIQNKI